MSRRISILRLVIVLLLTVWATVAGHSVPVIAAPAMDGPVDAAELASWVDPLIEQQMAEAQIPGAVLVVVKDGKVLYTRGYGQADVVANRPVDAENSVWRLMSVSKVVTALAVLQLAEQGKIDLNTDVNQYLKRFRLPATFPQPVTADRLLTHTAGLDWDVDNVGTAVTTSDKLLGLSSFLAKQPPARIFPPGQRYLYSNGAYDLLGALVEDVSGLPFAGYVQQQVFGPLGMKASSFAQPPATTDLVTGYVVAGMGPRAVPLPLWQNPPSRSLTASASDMGRLLIALLGDGQPVLKPATLANMLTSHFAYQSDRHGWAYGLDKFSWAGTDWFFKDGSADGAFSRIVLVPGQRMGFFIAYNVNDGSALAGAIMQQFLKRYYPIQSQTPAAAAGAGDRGRALEGVYRPFTYSHHTLAKLLRLNWPDYPRVSVRPDGHLAVAFGPAAEAVADLVEVAPLHYRSSDGQLDYVFMQDGAGNVTGFNVEDFVEERVPWYDTQRAHRLALGGFLLVFLGGALVWPAVLVARRRQGRPVTVSRLARRAAWLLTVTAAMILLLMAALLMLLKSAGGSYAFGMPPVTAAVVVGLQVTSLLTLGLVAAFLLLWRRRALAARGLVLYGLFTLVALAFIPWLNYWNLLGIKW